MGIRAHLPPSFATSAHMSHTNTNTNTHIHSNIVNCNYFELYVCKCVMWQIVCYCCCCRESDVEFMYLVTVMCWNLWWVFRVFENGSNKCARLSDNICLSISKHNSYARSFCSSYCYTLFIAHAYKVVSYICVTIGFGCDGKK